MLKDDTLKELSAVHNVARFVSFSPEGERRHVVLRSPCDARDQRELIKRLFDESDEQSVRVRTFLSEAKSGQPFTNQPVDKIDDTDSLVTSLRLQGFYVIVNESIDVNDGGVSGVMHGPVIEFSPRAVPRCVEMPGVFSAESHFGLGVLKEFYGFVPDLASFKASERVEFSLHPIPRGVAMGHTVIWETENLPSPPDVPPTPLWPNNLSRVVGDKVFGLLMAHMTGLSVPYTNVIPRWIPPFSFGTKTGYPSHWLRTCPTERQPGKFSTVEGWKDPFALLSQEDPTHSAIASVLYQEAVRPFYSGAAWMRGGQEHIEGVSGKGDDFMMGRAASEKLPDVVLASVSEMLRRAFNRFGSIEVEWVFDGKTCWIVQMHLAPDTPLPPGWIFVGDANEFLTFNVDEGLSKLRERVAQIAKVPGKGIELVGDVGLTSHLCDLLRKHSIPSRLRRITTGP